VPEGQAVPEVAVPEGQCQKGSTLVLPAARCPLPLRQAQRLQHPAGMAHPNRNDRISYKGRSTYLITAVTCDRRKAFADIEFGRRCELLLAEHAAREQFDIPAYCMMLDHIHLVAIGRTRDSDLQRFITKWKQATGFAWSQLGHGRLWQPGYWDRLARFDEPLDTMTRYVVENPVRANLATKPEAYPLTGAIVRDGPEEVGQH
jgi:putative transposase